MTSHQMQLGINHGSAAGPDSQVGINAPMGESDNVNINAGNVNVPHAAMDRGCSPLGAPLQSPALDEALTDDSLGLTPPKSGRFLRGRASSVQARSLGRPPLTKRSLSSSRKSRPPMRVASPAALKRLRSAGAPVVATDDSVQARLAALEQQVRQDHLYKLEIVQAIQGLQTVATAGQTRLETVDQHGQELELHRTQFLEMRRELFAVRDQLTEKVNFVVQQAEMHLKGDFVDVIENKFAQLEAAIKTMHGHLGTQHLVDKPNEKHIVSNAFKYVDDKISQVTEIVKKFEGADGVVQAAGGHGVAFTAKMREDMSHMHNKLVNIDNEVAKTVGDNSIPIYEQLNVL